MTDIKQKTCYVCGFVGSEKLFAKLFDGCTRCYQEVRKSNRAVAAQKRKTRRKKTRIGKKNRDTATLWKAKESYRKRYALNPEKVRQEWRKSRRKYYIANKDKEIQKATERSKERMRKRYAANPEKVREEWRKATNKSRYQKKTAINILRLLACAGELRAMKTN